ncbi:hypothetical protein [Flavobacterium sp. XS2P39]|uniref:hypothetical protein n=1 Tax=Flavobacterium sp. XS2P39 TaxID=3401725 RepID=UPI003AAECF50
MKKITLLVASIFLFGGGVANAAEKTSLTQERRLPADFRNAEPIVFTERGIEFFVFPDGQLDFNTRPSNGDYKYNKSNKRGPYNKTYGAQTNTRNRNYGVKVEHDNMGRVRRVGNVSINYDSNDRIKRVGTVYMTYNRYALERVGGLEIIYNRRGQIVDIIGSVKGGRADQYSQNGNDYNDYEYANNQNSNDNDDYYYRTSGQKVQKEETRVAGSVAIRIDKRF